MKKAVTILSCAVVAVATFGYQQDIVSASPCEVDVPAPAPTPAPKPTTPTPVPAPKPAPAPAPKPTTPVTDSTSVPAPMLAKPVEPPVQYTKAGDVIMEYKLLGTEGKAEVRIINGDSYVGIRSLAYDLRADIVWNATKRQVVIKTMVTGTSLEIALHSNGKLAIVNGQALFLREPMRNINGTLYIQTHSLADLISEVMKKPMKASISKNVLEIK